MINKQLDPSIIYDINGYVPKLICYPQIILKYEKRKEKYN